MTDRNLPVPLTNVHVLSYIEHEGQILFSSREIGLHLGYANPVKAISNLYSRNINELQGFSVVLKLRTTDGKKYETRHFTEEGVYIISMLANTPAAQNFRAMLAKLLREIRERRIALAREAGYAQGWDEALCLPVMEAERKKGYLAGLKEGRRLAGAGDRLRVLERIYAYLQKGLNHAEIGKIVGLSASAVSHRVSRAKRLGFWPRDCKTAQAALPGVAQ